MKKTADQESFRCSPRNEQLSRVDDSKKRQTLFCPDHQITDTRHLTPETIETLLFKD